MQLTLYYQPRTRAQRVRWALEELELDYRLEYVDLFRGEGNTRAYRAIHPLGRLPALKIGEEVMMESGAILHWLADRHPEKGLAPGLDSPDRGSFDQWMYFAATTLEGPAWQIVLHERILPPERAVKAIIPFAAKQLGGVLRVLERALEGRDYLVDGRFSAADIMTGYLLAWFPERLAHYPALQSYLARLVQRPAFQRAADDTTRPSEEETT